MTSEGLETSLGRVSEGDCLSLMSKLPAGLVDLAFADPPFNIGYEYDVYQDRKQSEEYLAWSSEWVGQVHRVLKPNGTFWLAIGDEYAAEMKLLCQDLGFISRSWVIWYYTFGVNCTRKFSRSHAHLFHFVKDPKDFTFRESELENRIPSARQLVYNDSRANPKGRLPDDTWILRPQDLLDQFTPAEDSWYFPRVAGTFRERAGFHGCQMPEQLLGRILRICSRENDVVLDPFSGSATTLVVAKKLGRRFVGFELSKDYAERGNLRLDSVRRGDPLEGTQEPRVSAPPTPVSGASKHASGTSKRAKKATQAVKPLESAGSANSIKNALVECFRLVHEGYSLDRVIADPILNAKLIHECQEHSLPGNAAIWNHMLFGLRKAGRLVSCPTYKRTEISWVDCDRFLFATEIAMRKMKDEGCSTLDELLCDPDKAAKFDRIAEDLAPGFKPLEYRWGALKLRKEAKTVRQRAQILNRPKLENLLSINGTSLQMSKLQKMPRAPGIYLISGTVKSSILYVGGALNLFDRLTFQFGEERLANWRSEWQAQTVRYVSTEGSDPIDLLTEQSRYVVQYSPKLNDLGSSVA